MIKKTAIVTGGSSGLGYATSVKLINDGYNVVITGRDIEKLEKAKMQLGDNCFLRQIDAGDLEAVPSFVKEIKETFGSIDVLVNNAGINLKKSLIDVTDQEFQNIINVNTTGVFSLTREVVKVMKDQESKGNIVNISSMAAKYGLPYVIAYSASKTAIEGMTRALAVELGPIGIRVNAVAPGFILTAMVSKALDSDPERKQKVLSRTPLGRLGEPIDIANAISFLVSDKAKFIHGAILNVDGGNSIGF